ncbi:hypothetical protein PAXRUDRAFT_823873 [Paxillus rubicundulus Ve08.2h10]|uniref:Uncharacterized protein n=1 Tax=Paxillus rubicundulus Ve08.2h10 TaxID=930991 RepID=A0A0D0E316_9AGAM|nr:hypothetical protein PAXRUDRAFT_823873 [Paxillus rubicundulus Ve08.2h10]
MSEFAPANLNLAHLRRKMDIRNLTLYVAGQNNIEKGRLYMLWRDGNFIVIQAEPYCRPGITYDYTMPFSYYIEEYRAYNYLKEVIQTMLDTIVFDSENNWAHLIRQKDDTYRLVYTKKRSVHNCPIWTKVVDLDDIEVTRLVDGLYWEGIYKEQEVDLYIGWEDVWGTYITCESRGQKLMQSLGLGHYCFELLAHVSKNGAIIGLMMEAYIGRGITLADRSAVFEAVADIQRHGVLLMFARGDILITKQGVRFASLSSAKKYQDQDELAKVAESVHWKTLADMFDNIDHDPFGGCLSSSRTMQAGSFVIPRLPTPGRPFAFTPEELVIRWAWSIATSDALCRSNLAAPTKPQAPHRSFKRSTVARRDKRIKGDGKIILAPDVADSAQCSALVASVDRPLLITSWGRSSNTRALPYARPTPRRLLLAEEDDPPIPMKRG